MKVQIDSHVSIEVTTDAELKYLFNIPLGAPYEDVFKALEVLKSSVKQIQEQKLKEKEVSEKKEE